MSSQRQIGKARVFHLQNLLQVYPNAIHFNPLHFSPSMSHLGVPVLCLKSSIVVSRYWDILVNSTTI